MAKHIIIGFDGEDASAESFPVYVGNSGDDAQTAMRTSTAARFKVYSNAVGLRKNNPHRLKPGVHVDDQNIWQKALEKRAGALEAARRAEEALRTAERKAAALKVAEDGALNALQRFEAAEAAHRAAEAELAGKEGDAKVAAEAAAAQAAAVRADAASECKAFADAVARAKAEADAAAKAAKKK